VEPSASLDTRATGNIRSPLPKKEPRSPGRPARSQDYTDQLIYPAQGYFSKPGRNIVLSQTIARLYPFF